MLTLQNIAIINRPVPRTCTVVPLSSSSGSPLPSPPTFLFPSPGDSVHAVPIYGGLFPRDWAFPASWVATTLTTPSMLFHIHTHLVLLQHRKDGLLNLYSQQPSQCLSGLWGTGLCFPHQVSFLNPQPLLIKLPAVDSQPLWVILSLVYPAPSPQHYKL